MSSMSENSAVTQVELDISEHEERDIANSDSFYSDAAQYWSGIPATVDGMLGGFGFISHTDVQGSEVFLKSLFMMKDHPNRDKALDCGAGIGRVTKLLLQKYFNSVDLVEQNPTFLQEAKAYLESSKKIGTFFPVGLQEFFPEQSHYDVIWSQWVLGHLTDDDFIRFFQRCREALKPNGIIVVKENVTSGSKVEVDQVDSSVTRPSSVLSALFKQAGLKKIKEQKQRKFPRGLYEVKMYALRPDTVILDKTSRETNGEGETTDFSSNNNQQVLNEQTSDSLSNDEDSPSSVS